MNKQHPFFTMKIRRWSYSFLSTGILLFSVLHPVVAWADDVFTREDEEWFWHERLMEQLRQQQQQPQDAVMTVEMAAKICLDNGLLDFPYVQTFGGTQYLANWCLATTKGDYNTAWINIKRLANVLSSKNYFDDGANGLKRFLDNAATGMIRDYGWTPPEYR